MVDPGANDGRVVDTVALPDNDGLLLLAGCSVWIRDNTFQRFGSAAIAISRWADIVITGNQFLNPVPWLFIGDVTIMDNIIENVPVDPTFSGQLTVQ